MTLRPFFTLLVVLAWTVNACDTPQAEPPPQPVPVPATPTPLPPLPEGDKCASVQTLVRSQGCTLPPEWLPACRVARAHGATFHLACFALATTCEAVAACMNQEG